MYHKVLFGILLTFYSDVDIFRVINSLTSVLPLFCKSNLTSMGKWLKVEFFWINNMQING